MAHQIVIEADQFIPGKAAQFDKGVVGVGDASLEIGLGNNVLALDEGDFNLRNRQIFFHLLCRSSLRAKLVEQMAGLC